MPVTIFVSALLLEHISNQQIWEKYSKSEDWTRQQATYAQHRSCWRTWPACHWANLQPQWATPVVTKSITRNCPESQFVQLDVGWQIHINQNYIIRHDEITLYHYRWSVNHPVHRSHPFHPLPTYEVYRCITTSQGTQCTTARMAWRRLLHESMAWHNSLLRKHRRLGSRWPPPPPSLTLCLGKKWGQGRLLANAGWIRWRWHVAIFRWKEEMEDKDTKDIKRE